MKLSCPVCDNSVDLEPMSTEKEIVVRGEPYRVQFDGFRCRQCGEEFLDGASPDPFDAAYQQYRERHGMLSPDDIRSFRHKYGLTQAELAGLLGLGGATLSRYETGKLQDMTHDTLLRMAMKPECLQSLVVAANTLTDERKQQLLSAIESDEDGLRALERCMISTGIEKEPDEFSGYRPFDRVRFVNAIRFFARNGVLKTKLNKLLFYADFLHYRDFATSITGARYARIPFGPAPEDYDLFFSLLSRQGVLRVEEVLFQGYSGSEDVTGEKLISIEEPDRNVFADSELESLLRVKRYFEDYGAGMISQYSHQEEAYRNTLPGQLISYEYAATLSLP